MRDPNPEETEQLETFLVPLDEAIDMLNRGDFLQALHVSSIYFALKELKYFNSAP
ncbi:MAG: hypothetical protein HY787_18410 [Deltaproteobacteria bacterium]|nr:hypothetical protein [Deltaproteobacteria bacterium]